MKRLILCMAVVGVTSCAAEQGTSTHLTGVAYAPSTKITASDITYDEAQRTTYARGHVRIVSDSSTITADEADVHLLKVGPNQYRYGCRPSWKSARRHHSIGDALVSSSPQNGAQDMRVERALAATRDTTLSP